MLERVIIIIFQCNLGPVDHIPSWCKLV